MKASQKLDMRALQGGVNGGGGSQCLQMVQAMTFALLEATPRLKSLTEAQIQIQDFKEKLSLVKFDVMPNLTKDGKPVDALNFPDEKSPKIIMTEQRCDQVISNFDEGMGFLVHEVLGLMKKETREDYWVSKKVLLELKKVVVKKTKPDTAAVCTVRRWHYSGANGGNWEYFPTVSTSAWDQKCTGNLRGRWDHDLQGYDVCLYPKLNHDPSSPSYGTYSLFYGLNRDPLWNGNWQVLIPQTLIDFESRSQAPSTPGRVVIPLLGPEAFSREGKETSSRLEMICYQTP